MKRVGFLGMMLLLAVLQPEFAGADGLNGRYVADTEAGLAPDLIETSDGGVTGTLAQNGDAQQNVTFTPADGAPQETEPGEIKTDRQRNVVINGVRLSDDELASAERMHRIHIPDANYWYDLATGAWGAQGGQTLGFIAPGLTLGGTLQPNASGGGTGVFVNGRELNPYDRASLEKMTGPIAPGRYFITAQGLAGYEGGDPVYDLNALAPLGQGGGSGSWKSRLTGASGVSGGTTGAVFLPNGGIVSTGN